MLPTFAALCSGASPKTSLQTKQHILVSPRNTLVEVGGWSLLFEEAIWGSGVRNALYWTEFFNSFFKIKFTWCPIKYKVVINKKCAATATNTHCFKWIKAKYNPTEVKKLQFKIHHTLIFNEDANYPKKVL